MADYRALFFSFGRYVAAQALVAVSTLIALWIASRWGSAAVEMIYLPAVLAAGIWWGFGPAVLAAVTSALSYNYFFTEPLYTFRINSAVDIVDVTILFLVAVVTSQLASAIRSRPRSPRRMRLGTPRSRDSQEDCSPAQAKTRSPRLHAGRSAQSSIAMPSRCQAFRNPPRSRLRRIARPSRQPISRRRCTRFKVAM